MPVKIDCVYCNVPCCPRSNLNLVHYLWSKFVYYCNNYGLIVLPSLTSGVNSYMCATIELKSGVANLGFVESAYGFRKIPIHVITFPVKT
jgi:hypothetical protein